MSRPKDATHVRAWEGVVIYLKTEGTRLFVWEDELRDREPQWVESENLTQEYIANNPTYYERLQ